MSEIVAIINQKGGTGKTTTSQNLGYGLAQKGKRVLFIDLDPQGNLTFSCGVNEFEYTLADIIYQDVDIKEAIINVGKNLDLVPTSIDLAHTELFLSKAEEREYILSKALKKVKKNYDYIIIDCQTSLSVLTINALTAASGIIIPLQLTILSLKGLDLIVSTLEEVKGNLNKNVKILGVLPVMIDKRRKLTEEVIDIIKENFDIPIYKSYIGQSVRVAEAPSFGKSVMEYAPNCKVAVNYKDFVKEFLKR
ncbi:MAG: AAA family ATPase [Cyclobacteriaceae bacterium]|nr:AAA family ATPase [Cyclobacteriaceae bacterium]